MRNPEQFGRQETYPSPEQVMPADYQSPDPKKGIERLKNLLSAIETTQH